MAAEHALLHAEFLHLLENHRRFGDVGPKDDGIDARVLDHLKFVAEIGVARTVFLFDDDGVPDSAGGVTEIEDPEAAGAVLDPKKCDALETKFGIVVSRERLYLHAIVLDIRVVPRDDRFRDGGIGRSAVDEWSFGLERQP